MRSPTQTHSPDTKPTSFCSCVLVLRVQRRTANINCIVCLDELPHSFQGRIKDFKLGGGVHLNNWTEQREARTFLGISCEKSRFYAKISYFFQLWKEAPKCLGISCEKSRFYAKQILFFPILGGGAGCAPLWNRPCIFCYTKNVVQHT